MNSSDQVCRKVRTGFGSDVCERTFTRVALLSVHSRYMDKLKSIRMMQSTISQKKKKRKLDLIL